MEGCDGEWWCWRWSGDGWDYLMCHGKCMICKINLKSFHTYIDIISAEHDL